MRQLLPLLFLLIGLVNCTFGQPVQDVKQATSKIKVEIWSDVVCPFCYMGKTNFDRALAKFEHKDDVEVVWRSYQLDPTLPKEINDTYENYLIQKKNWSKAQVRNAFNDIAKEGKKLGLKYNFDLLKIANSYNAHLLIQFAGAQGKGSQVEDALFKAYFTDGANIGDVETIVKIGTSIGLEEKSVRDALKSVSVSISLERDLKRAKEVNVSSVPFFLFNQKLVMLGAQPEEAFLEMLKSIYEETKK